VSASSSRGTSSSGATNARRPATDFSKIVVTLSPPALSTVAGVTP
jgi:hypothetical protein